MPRAIGPIVIRGPAALPSAAISGSFPSVTGVRARTACATPVTSRGGMDATRRPSYFAGNAGYGARKIKEISLLKGGSHGSIPQQRLADSQRQCEASDPHGHRRTRGDEGLDPDNSL